MKLDSRLGPKQSSTRLCAMQSSPKVGLSSAIGTIAGFRVASHWAPYLMVVNWLLVRVKPLACEAG